MMHRQTSSQSPEDRTSTTRRPILFDTGMPNVSASEASLSDDQGHTHTKDTAGRSLLVWVLIYVFIIGVPIVIMGMLSSD